MGAQATCCARGDKKDREAEAAAKALCPKEDPDMTAADKVKVLRHSMRTSIRQARADVTLVGRAVAGLTGRTGRQPGRPSQRPLAQDTTRIYQVQGVASGKSLAGQYEFKGQWHHSRRVYRRQDGAFFMYSWSTATGTEQDGWWVAARVGAHQEAAGAAAFNRQNAQDPPAGGWCVGTLANIANAAVAEEATFSVKLLKGNPVNKAPRILAGRTAGGARPSLVVRFAAEVVKEDGEVVPMRGDPASSRNGGKGDDDEATNFAIGDKVCWISFDDEIPEGSVGEIVGFTQDRVRARFGDEVFKFRFDELSKAKMSPTSSEDMDRTPTDDLPKRKDEKSRPGSPGKRPAAAAAAGGNKSPKGQAARGGRGSAEPKQGGVIQRANSGAGADAEGGKHLTMAQKEALWELLERVRREKVDEEQGASAIQAVWRRRQFLKAQQKLAAEQQGLAAEQQGKGKVDFTLPEAPSTPSNAARGRAESDTKSDPKKGTRANNVSSSAGPEVGRGSASRDRNGADFARSNSRGRGGDNKGGGEDPLAQWGMIEESGDGRSQRAPPGAKAAANARSASASAATRRDRASSRLAAPVVLRASEGCGEVRLTVAPKSGRVDNGTTSGRPKRDKAEDKDKKLKKEKAEKSDTGRK